MSSKSESPLRQSSKKGLPPGTLVHIGRRRREKTVLQLIDYTEKTLDERELTSVDESGNYGNDKSISWINVIGLQDMGAIAAIGKAFELHPLLQEDVVDTGQRPKVQDYGSSIYVTVRLFYFDQKTFSLESEQVSLVLGKGFVLSFQEDARDVFDPIRDAIRTGKGKLRDKGADYLLYRLFDIVVDSYFEVLEQMGNAIDGMEESMLKTPNPALLNRIHKLRRNIIAVRKGMWPLREVIGVLERLKTPLIEEGTELYLRDVYDHIVQVIDTVETYRDMLGTMVDQYLSIASNRMNEIMKVLTVIATIFMPLTFIAGIYGMNFRHMPELTWPYGYPVVLSTCTLIGIGMLIYFRRKGWL